MLREGTGREALGLRLGEHRRNYSGLAPVAGEEKWEDIPSMHPEVERYSRHTDGHRMQAVVVETSMLRGEIHSLGEL